VVVSCLTLHHFSPREAVTVLSEMWRVARRGLVVVDLTRGVMAYVGTWLATRAIARSRVTRYDGPLSVLRAYTPAEMCSLGRQAGLENIRHTRHMSFRQTLVATRGGVE
jgi:hypothetical protein